MPVMEHANLLNLSARSTLYREGDEARSLFKVQRGFLRATTLTPEGQILTVRHYLPGDYFGEETLAKINPHYHVTVEALVASTVEALPVEAVQQVIALALVSLAQQMERQLQLTYIQQVGDLRQRVERYLQFLAETPLATELEEGIAVAVTHELLAEGTNSTRGSVSKVVADMKGDGLIDVGYRSIVLTGEGW